MTSSSDSDMVAPPSERQDDLAEQATGLEQLVRPVNVFDGAVGADADAQLACVNEGPQVGEPLRLLAYLILGGARDVSGQRVVGDGDVPAAGDQRRARVHARRVEASSAP